jgi:mono/diheme cytochrome c family protein
MNRTMLIAASVIISTVGVCRAEEVDKDKPILEINTGKSNYETSCASCHGADGKGKGPVSAQLKVPPSDLTVLAKKNNGAFPVDSVYEVIDGQQAVLAHGPRDMPIWGVRYKSNGIHIPGADKSTFDPDAVVRSRILSVVDYLKEIQEK